MKACFSTSNYTNVEKLSSAVLLERIKIFPFVTLAFGFSGMMHQKALSQMVLINNYG